MLANALRNNGSEIEEILNTSIYLHLGLLDDGMPYVIPMNYGIKYYDTAS